MLYIRMKSLSKSHEDQTLLEMFTGFLGIESPAGLIYNSKDKKPSHEDHFDMFLVLCSITILPDFF